MIGVTGFCGRWEEEPCQCNGGALHHTTVWPSMSQCVFSGCKFYLGGVGPRRMQILSQD